MSKLIISPADEAPIKGVDSGLDSIGRGNAEPIESNPVVLTYSREELGAGGNRPLSDIPNSKS